MTQTDAVLQGIKAMITDGQMDAGSRLPSQKDLAAALGVSGGPLREGVRALCIMGVLETRQGDGTYVTSLDTRQLLAPMGFMIELQTPEHRQHLHAVRCVLESEAAGRAALGMTAEQLAEATAVLESVRSRVLADQITDHEAIIAADLEFHRIVLRASENETLVALVDVLTDGTPGTRHALGVDWVAQVRRGYEMHTAILDALKQGNPDAARLLMSRHLREGGGS